MKFIKEKIIKKVLILMSWLGPLLIIFSIYLHYNQRYVGASDWYGYYSEAQLFKKGRIAMDTELSPTKYPAIAPVGYFVREGKVLPIYPPGYPLIMAFAGFLNLEFYVTPFIGIITVVLMFLILKGITNKKIAIVFSIIWAFFPIVVYGSTSLMSDLVATFFLLLCWYLFKKNKVGLSGLALGFSLAVRPTNFLFCLVFLPFLLKRKHIIFRFGINFIIPVLLYGAYNWIVYGAPWKTGYTKFSQSLLLSVFPQHFTFYAKEILIQFTPILLILALVGIWHKNQHRIFYSLWFLVFLVFYSCWNYGDNTWWWIRFLLPGFPALFFLSALGAKNLGDFFKERFNHKKVVTHILKLIIPIGIVTYFIIYGHQHSDIWKRNKGKYYYDVSKSIEGLVPETCLVGSVDFSGSIRLYTRVKSFNLSHPAAPRLVRKMLKKKIPVFIVKEPLHSKNPFVKWVYSKFTHQKVHQLSNKPVLFLYEVKKHISN